MPERPRSLVFLVPGFPEDEADSACLPAVQNYVAAFARAYPDVQTHVVAFQYPFARRTYAWKRATVHALAGKNRRSLRRLATWRRAALTVRRIHRQTTILALHSFWLTECTWVARRLSKRLRIRHIASIGGQDAQASNPYVKGMKLDGVVLTAGSAFAAETFAQHAHRQVDQVIPLGLDTDFLQHLDAPAIRDIDVLGVGSLIPVKDYATFIDVVAELRSAFPHVRACLLGDGPQRDALHRQIAERGLQQHVALRGRVPREEVFRHMLRSRVFLHTARYESQGYVFLEALFAGLPVVCFAVGYTGGTDRVFHCQSPREMADVVADLLRTPPPFHQTPVPTTADTVRAFESLYGI